MARSKPLGVATELFGLPGSMDSREGAGVTGATVSIPVLGIRSQDAVRGAFADAVALRAQPLRVKFIGEPGVDDGGESSQPATGGADESAHAEHAA